MTRPWFSCARSLAVAAVVLSALGLSMHASQRAADAEEQAIGAWRQATAPQRVTVDWSPVDDVAREADVTRQCVELLWLQVNQIVRQWPQAPATLNPPTACPLPPFERPGAVREWKGRVMAPPGTKGKR